MVLSFLNNIEVKNDYATNQVRNIDRTDISLNPIMVSYDFKISIQVVALDTFDLALNKTFLNPE